MASETNTFITATTKDNLRPGPQARKLIRQHVMKGRNRKAKVLNVAVSDHGRQLLSQVAAPDVQIRKFLSPKTLACMSDFIAIMQQAMYPVYCLVDLPSSSEQMFAHLRSDLECARSFHHIAQAYHSITAYGSLFDMDYHMHEALRTLQRQLSSTEAAFEDRLVLTVLMLGMFAESHGDFTAARAHMSGLAAIINLRGGMSSLSSMLQIKACRLDLRLALRTLSAPSLAIIDALSASTYATRALRSKVGLSPSLFNPRCTCDWLAENVHTIYDDFRSCTLQFNLATQTGRKVTPEFFQHSLSSVLYRLLHLCLNNNAVRQCSCEVLLLAMLVLGSKLFLRSDDEHCCPYELLALQLKENMSTLIEHQDDASDSQQSRILLWLAMIARLAASCGSTDSEASRTRLLIRRLSARLNLTTWKALRAVVKDFLWVDVLLDAPGKRLWASSCCTLDTTRPTHPVNDSHRSEA